jgi:SAM-dependent methyltransferase
VDIWHYYDVAHRDHLFCNPIGADRVDQVLDLLELKDGQRVLDIACGHGEFLRRCSQRAEVETLGVDLSPYASRRAIDRGVNVLVMDAKEHRPDEPFDVVSCMGASWIWDGYEGTLRALIERSKGLIVVGEPYWIEEPPTEYLEAEGMTRDLFPSLAQYRATALELGLELVWMAGSTLAEWDHYEMQQTAAVDRFARAEPNHPDLAEIRERRRTADEIYVRWGRRCCGYALWLFRIA